MKQYNRVLFVNICCSLGCLLAQKAKRTEQMKQYNQQNEMVPWCHWCGLEVTAKRAEQMKQYNQQYKDVAEQAETSKLGPFGADPFGLTFGADPLESQPDFENSF